LAHLKKRVTKEVMMNTHQAHAVDSVVRWHLRRGGELCVSTGRVWLTVDGDRVDHVLSPGDRLHLVPGADITLESWEPNGRAPIVVWTPDAVRAVRLVRFTVSALVWGARHLALGLQSVAVRLRRLADRLEPALGAR
jgi:hypothetical protein